MSEAATIESTNAPITGRPSWLPANFNEPAAPNESEKSAEGVPADAKIPDRAAPVGAARGSDPRANKPADDEKDEDGQKWPRSSADWKAFKANRKAEAEAAKKETEALAAKVKEYEAKLKEVPAAKPEPEGYDPEWKPKLTAAEKRAQELDERLKLVAVEKHPDFERYFKGKTDEQMDLAGKIVPIEKADRVKKILALQSGEWRDSQIEELLSDMTTMQQSRFGAVVNALDRLEIEKGNEISNYSARYQQLRESEKSKSEQTRTANAARVKSVVEATRAKLADSPAYQKRDGDEAWNKEVEGRFNVAQALIDGKVSVEQGVEAAYHAAAFPALLQSVKAMDSEHKAKIAELEAKVAALSASTPSAGGGRTAATTTEKKAEFRSGVNPMEMNKSWMAALPKIGA